jgi:hypothetical protein
LSPVEALERCGNVSADPATALRDAVEALWTMAAQAASAEPGAASRRADVMRRSERILASIIRRGLASGAFRPRCPRWAESGLVHALVAGACARWVFGLPEERALRAGPAADAALEVLAPDTKDEANE